MNDTRPSRRDGRALLRVLAAALLVGGCGLLALGSAAPPDTCSPDAPRPWAAEAYKARTEARTPAPWPSPSPVPAPAEVTADGKRVIIVPPPEPPDAPEAWERFERVTVAAGEAAVLPGDGRRWTARIVAWRPSRSEWLDPATGEPIAFDPGPGMTTFSEDGHFEFIIDVHVDCAGGEAVDGLVATRGGSLFDRTTGVHLNAYSSHSLERGRLRLSTGGAVAHRADLMLEVMLCYGDPEVLDLEARRGAQARTADGFTIRLEHVGPGRANGMSFGMDGRRTARLTDVDPDGGAWTVGFTVWPAPWADRVLVQNHGDRNWSGISRGTGLLMVTWIDSPRPERLRFHALPHAARVQFTLPPPATLPKIDDLYTLPAPETDDPYGYFRALEERLQVQLPDSVTGGAQVPDANTAGEALQALVDQTGAYHDRWAFRVDRGGAGLLRRALAFVRGLLP